MSMAATATGIIREHTAFSVSEHCVDANRRNPARSLQDGMHRDDAPGHGDISTAPPGR
jgi:hypothetical protein